MRSELWQTCQYHNSEYLFHSSFSFKYDDKEAYESFKRFYEDTLPEFRKAGSVVQFKVKMNNIASYMAFGLKQHVVMLPPLHTGDLLCVHLQPL